MPHTPAKPCSIRDLHDYVRNKHREAFRVRLVGVVIGIEAKMSKVLLMADAKAISVDVSMAIGEGDSYMPSLKDTIMVVGEFSHCEKVKLPPLQIKIIRPPVPTKYEIRAYVVKIVNELDLKQYNKALDVVRARMEERRSQ